MVINKNFLLECVKNRERKRITMLSFIFLTLSSGGTEKIQAAFRFEKCRKANILGSEILGTKYILQEISIRIVLRETKARPYPDRKKTSEPAKI